MSDLKAICEVLGTERAEELKDYILGAIENDIDESLRNTYNYVISPDTFTELGEEVFEEVKAELKRKYKKQLKGVLESKILKVISDAESVVSGKGEVDSTI